MSYEKYGLTAIDAQGSDHSKGIVAGPDGKFYKIDGFKSEGEDEGGIDKNAGKVFSSSLESDAGVDFTNFNTAQDVENALGRLDGGGGSRGFHTPSENLEMSKELSDAKERAKNWIDSQGMGGDPYGKDTYGDGSAAAIKEVDFGENDKSSYMASRLKNKVK